MAQKRVSVRLVAEGGRQVKAEFQGIGDAGERNFKRIERQADITGAVVRRVMGILGAAISTRQLVTTGIILALLAGIALKLKIFGPGG